MNTGPGTWHNLHKLHEASITTYTIVDLKVVVGDTTEMDSNISKADCSHAALNMETLTLSITSQRTSTISYAAMSTDRQLANSR